MLLFIQILSEYVSIVFIGFNKIILTIPSSTILLTNFYLMSRCLVLLVLDIFWAMNIDPTLFTHTLMGIVRESSFLLGVAIQTSLFLLLWTVPPIWLLSMMGWHFDSFRFPRDRYSMSRDWILKLFMLYHHLLHSHCLSNTPDPNTCFSCKCAVCLVCRLLYLVCTW